MRSAINTFFLRIYRRTYDKEHNKGQIVVSREIYAKSAVMIGGFFLGGGQS